MSFQILKSNSPTYVDGFLYTVNSVGEPEPADHGFKQRLVLTDGEGLERGVTVYTPKNMPDRVLEPEYEGKKAVFKLRCKFGDDGEYYTGYPTETEPPEKLEKAENSWERKDRRIAKQNVLRTAVMFYDRVSCKPNDIDKLAKHWLDWIYEDEK